MKSFVKVVVGLLMVAIIYPMALLAIAGVTAYGAYNTVSDASEDYSADVTVEHARQQATDDEAATDRLAQTQAAHKRCEPIITLYCSRRSVDTGCDTKEIEYLCLTDDSITPQNYRQVVREYRHKVAAASSAAHSADRHYESGRDWFWL